MKTENQPPSELRETLNAQRPLLLRAMGFSIVGGLLALASTFYMLEVYDRVVNSRNHLTLAMLTLAVIGAYLVTQIVDLGAHDHVAGPGATARARTGAANLSSDVRCEPAAVARRTEPMNDLRTLCEFMATPVLAAIMEAPVAIVFLILIFTISPVLGWAAVAGAVVQVGLAWFNSKEHAASALGSQPNGPGGTKVCRRNVAQRGSHRVHGHAARHSRSLDHPAAPVPEPAGPGVGLRRSLSGRRQTAADGPVYPCCWAWALGCSCRGE